MFERTRKSCENYFYRFFEFSRTIASVSITLWKREETPRKDKESQSFFFNLPSLSKIRTQQLLDDVRFKYEYDIE